MQLGPYRQQRLQTADQRHVDANEDGGTDGERSQCAFCIAACDDGVDDPEGHHGQLADQHRTGVRSDHPPFVADAAHVRV